MAATIKVAAFYLNRGLRNSPAAGQTGWAITGPNKKPIEVQHTVESDRQIDEKLIGRLANTVWQRAWCTGLDGTEIQLQITFE